MFKWFWTIFSLGAPVYFPLEFFSDLIKHRERSDLNNYRPILIVPVIA